MIASRGSWGTVEWAVDSRGSTPAHDFYEELSEKDKAKVAILFKYLANSGCIPNREKFRQLGPKAGPKGQSLWEFKSFQIRLIGDFRKGARFLVAHGTHKKKDKLSKADIEKAIRILAENDEQEARGRVVR